MYFIYGEILEAGSTSSREPIVINCEFLGQFFYFQHSTIVKHLLAEYIQF